MIAPNDPESEVEHYTIITLSYILNSPFPPFYEIICCSTENDGTSWEERKQQIVDKSFDIANLLAPQFLKASYDLNQEDIDELGLYHDIVAIFRGRLIDVLGNKVRVN